LLKSPFLHKLAAVFPLSYRLSLQRGKLDGVFPVRCAIPFALYEISYKKLCIWREGFAICMNNHTYGRESTAIEAFLYEISYKLVVHMARRINDTGRKIRLIRDEKLAVFLFFTATFAIIRRKY
jgi:hypothetical protein